MFSVIFWSFFEFSEFFYLFSFGLFHDLATYVDSCNYSALSVPMRITHFYDDVIIVIFTNLVGLYPITIQLSNSSESSNISLSASASNYDTRSCEKWRSFGKIRTFRVDEPKSSKDGHIGVSDEYWRRNILVTSFLCWWRICRRIGPKIITNFNSPTSWTRPIYPRMFLVRLLCN